MSGLATRLKKEVEILAPPGSKVEVIEPENRQWLSWIGASRFGKGKIILIFETSSNVTPVASSPDFPSHLVTREQYDEFGPTVEFGF